MRYFKCDAQPEAQDFRRQYTDLTQREQKKQRRQKLRNMIELVLFFGITVLLLIVGLCLVWKFFSSFHAKNLLHGILLAAGGFAGAFVIILAPLLGILASFWIGGTDRTQEKSKLKQLLQKGCEQQREFYGFREPFLVTKCFDASDKRFRRHDVCLFMAEGELRLTVNLHYGFFDPARDLGCYAFSPEEVTLHMTQWKNHPALELTAGETTFLLGSQAVPFLKKEAGISPEPAQET